jgi:adenine-specific DNA methylase
MNPTTQETLDELKARGAFYTPPEVTAFLATWAIREVNDRALEPSCGDGAFIAAGAVRYGRLGTADLADRLFGVELEAGEAAKSRKQAPSANIRVSSFFDVMPVDLPTMDAIIGNPPYIRYHGFTGDDRKAGLARAAEQGVKLTQLASSWAHFVVHSTAFLTPAGGRLGLVLPAELLHTDYAEPVRDYLVKRFNSVIVIAFDRNIFDDAQVDAVLLLASDDDNMGMRLIRVHNAAALLDLDINPPDDAVARPHARRWSVTIDADVERIYADLILSDKAVHLGAMGSVDIGVVTGNNGYFIMSAAEAKTRKLPKKLLTPIVSRAGDIPGLMVKSSETSVLLDLRHRPDPTDAHLLAYLAQGIVGKVSEGYKCRTRKPWYGVPLPKVKPHAFLPYMNHHAPRLIINGPDAWSTNLIHGVTFFSGHRDVRAIAAAMLSAITWLSSEIEGRAYGGGVLKTETKEAERLLVPALTDATESALLARFDELDDLVRAGDYAKASAIVDEILDIDHERFIVAWEIFRSRRLGRKSKAA